ncbi:MAG: methyltransferase domain-containing protein [Desulfobacteraceae bacterium]|jgi:ubiquinone/menaquinone biosynthesis C-methylase UbiE
MITVDFQSISLHAGSCILDIGCGSGRHTAAAYDLNKGLVVGADTNVDDLLQARQKLCWHRDCFIHDRSLWSATGADITRLPFKAHSFDLVICSEVLEHISEHGRAIREITRVLKPGRHLVVSVPRRWPEAVCWALSRQYRTTPGGHIRIYRAGELIRRIESAGAVHRRTHYAHSLHSPFWWLKCLLGPDRDQLWPVELYHRFLTWDLMERPRLTRFLETALNPLLGKSVVLYFRKL